MPKSFDYLISYGLNVFFLTFRIVLTVKIFHLIDLKEIWYCLFLRIVHVFCFN